MNGEMSFNEAVDLLIDLQKRYPTVFYTFDEFGRMIVKIPVASNVPDLFDSARELLD